MKAESPKTELTAGQERALIALLSHATNAEAAKAAGVSEVTLWRWLRLPHFQERFEAMRHDSLKRAVAQLQVNSSDAARTLKDIATDKKAPANARVAAARALLEFGFRSVENDRLAREIDELKATFAAIQAASEED